MQSIHSCHCSMRGRFRFLKKSNKYIQNITGPPQQLALLLSTLSISQPPPSSMVAMAADDAESGGGKLGSTAVVVVGEEYCAGEERELTVQKTSLFFTGDGYAAYDHHTGGLVFRVDTYDRGPVSDQLVLMDSIGVTLLTVHQKWPSLHQRWEGFLGERQDGQKPLFTVRRSSIFGGGSAGVAVEVLGGAEYRVEGSFAQRCCRVVHEGEEDAAVAVVVEIKRKVEASAHMMPARDVFCLSVAPGFDSAFAMGLVLVLDQISGDDDGSGSGGNGDVAVLDDVARS